MKTQSGTLKDLRESLFDVIQRLKDGNDPDCDPKDTIDVDRAQAINNVAKTIISAAKTEVAALKIIAGYDDTKANEMLKDNRILQIN